MPVGPLEYLRRAFGPSFLTDYRALSDADKATLKQWAAEEMAVLNITE